MNRYDRKIAAIPGPLLSLPKAPHDATLVFNAGAYMCVLLFVKLKA